MRSSYSSKVVPLSCQAVCTISITTCMASSVDCCWRLPIWPSGRRPFASASSASYLAIRASIIFPTQLSSEIGRHAPACCCCWTVFPGFRRTTTCADRKHRGKYSSLKLSSDIVAIAWRNGLPQAFRNPVCNQSSPGALDGAMPLSTSCTSSSVTPWLMMVRDWKL